MITQVVTLIKQEEVVRQEKSYQTLNDIMNCRETSQSLTRLHFNGRAISAVSRNVRITF